MDPYWFSTTLTAGCIRYAEEAQTFKRLSFRHVLLQALNVISMVTPVLMLWQALTLVTNCASPIVVVLSESMEPAFSRGDLIFLTNPSSELYKPGDITVYKVPGADIPIVHRVMETHGIPLGVDIDQYTKRNSPSNPLDTAQEEGEEIGSHRQLMLTKGDNNAIDDIELYRGLEWLEKKHIVGKVKGYIPYVGYITIAMNDMPKLKYALFGIMGLVALIL